MSAMLWFPSPRRFIDAMHYIMLPLTLLVIRTDLEPPADSWMDLFSQNKRIFLPKGTSVALFIKHHGYQKFRVAKENFRNDLCAFAVAKDSPLLQPRHKLIHRMIDHGIINRLLSKHLPNVEALALDNEENTEPVLTFDHLLLPVVFWTFGMTVASMAFLKKYKN